MSTNGGSKVRETVPVLITWDVDPDRWYSRGRRLEALEAVMGLCDPHGIRATFFFTAEPAGEYVDIFASMQNQGHEIGCHGLTHGSEENYDQMPEDMQREYIGRATEKLESAAGVPIRSFRGPRVKTSATTLRLLAEYGYLADSSVCSQRADLLSSNLINTGWLFAPRRPYHPHRDSAYRRGDVALWEIPVSAAGLPFISSTMITFGLSTMKLLFGILYAESRRTGKPILYLAHPTEFFVSKATEKQLNWRERWKKNARLKYLRPSHIRAHGLRLRKVLYRMDPGTRLESTRGLLAHIASFPNVAFMTVSDYALSLGEEEHKV